MTTSNEHTKESPLLFKGAMVQAIMDGSKTETRRIIKRPIVKEYDQGTITFEQNFSSHQLEEESFIHHFCNYGKPGFGKLWVKETFRIIGTPEQPQIEYQADNSIRSISPDLLAEDDTPGGKWKPSIFMRRNYSRILLQLTGIKVQRVAEITATEAAAEGINQFQYQYNPVVWEIYPEYNSSRNRHTDPEWCDDPIKSFASLWDSINAMPKPIKPKDGDGKPVTTHYVRFPFHEPKTATPTYMGKPLYTYANPFCFALQFKVESILT